MQDLEARLRQALKPVDPGDDFTARVLARVAGEPDSATPPAQSATRFAPRPRKPLPRLAWLPALAASVVLAVVVRHEWEQRQEQVGRAARQQVLEALRVTSSKLDLAYQLVNAPAPVQMNGNSGT